ncbi:PfkB family carbohydrate kinase [Mucilaginibacter terrigena]|nr:PfkB family carbohydrate kinase [Mucilaginibacter terrigena]
MTEKAKQIQQCLQNAPSLLAGKKAAAGFDGFVDSIVKVVNYKTDDAGIVFFRTISEFGSYISGKSGSGFSLESEELVQKLGGNMPIMANALAGMGIGVNCVGAFGVPHFAPAFTGMHANCNLYSFTNPGFTTAMEFTDGKIMLAQMTDLNHADWATIKQTIGIENLKAVFGTADLICLVNWSELDHSNSMWQGLLCDVLNNSTIKQSQQFFFDLSDCSKRSAEAITSAIKLIEQFGAYGKVTLSLNRNEANILYKTLIGDAPPADLQAIGNKLFTVLNISTLIIHNSKISIAWDGNGTHINEPDFIANPKISTGAGDNFNAGYCIAVLLGLDAEAALMMANATSNIYMNSGDSPGLDALSEYFSK